MTNANRQTHSFAKDRTMSRILPIRARLLAAALLLSATALAGCGANPDRIKTQSIPDDYRTRHPIVLTEAEHTLDIPVATGDRDLPRAVRDNIRGFAAEHAAKSQGAVQIMLPRGSANAGTADRARKTIRTALQAEGVRRDRIIETSYDASGYGANAPIRLVFFAIAAKTGPCGEWPDDLVENTMENRNYHNFGCATQSNLAAQIANPMDLVQPRGMSPIDAERRSVVIDDYREDGQPLLF